MSKVYVYLADGFEEVEALTVVDLLRRAAIDVTTVSIMGKQVTGRSNITVTADKLWDEVDAFAADMIVLPGGMPGTKYLSEHPGLADAIISFSKDESKYLAAICAAPSIYGRMGLTRGKDATCYPGMENLLEGANVKYDEVVVDGHLITSRGAGTAVVFSGAIIEALKDKETAKAVLDGIVYRQ